MAKFRAKARAIDLLGKGQIADLPTAITELWKNGYDAYADNIECNLYPQGYKNLRNPIFTLSDDGIGMSKQDLEEKWIVLGTDSKVRRNAIDEDERFGKKTRPQMGEKGIGRLSVAYLGYQMLLVTKKMNGKFNILFMDWRILDNFNLYIDDIDINIYEVQSIEELSNKFSSCLKDFKNNLEVGDWSEHKKLRHDIFQSLTVLELPEELLNQILYSFSGKEDHGTVFIIFNPHEQLLDLKDSVMMQDTTNYILRYLRTSLVGFYNSFLGQPPFKTRFWIHNSTGQYDIIQSTNFFSREEMFSLDHWLRGSFDEQGFFTGELKVYNEIIKHKFRAIRQPGKTPYGPFNIEFGFLEGDFKKSILPREQFDLMSKKLEAYGAMYIYRDGIRVLPYGQPSMDFLNFEERRSKRAGEYFFSHRRMMGYIGIAREVNPNLIDKAGREGFIKNNTYKEFVMDLEEFFIDLARRYFKLSDSETTLRGKQLEEVEKKNKKLLEAEKRKSKLTLTKFKEDLKDNEPKIEDLLDNIIDINDNLKSFSQQKVIIYNKIELLTENLENSKIQLRKLRLHKPDRVTLTATQEKKYYSYCNKLENAIDIIKECDEIIYEIQPRLSEENLISEFKNRLMQYNKDINNTMKDYYKRFKEATISLEHQFRLEEKNYYNLFTEKLAEIDVLKDENSNIKAKIQILQEIYSQMKTEIDERFEPFTKHIEQLNLDVNEELLLGWYRNQYNQIEKKMNALHELSQLGMTIEIIDHQFNVLYAEMAAAIKFFRIYTQKDIKAEEKYKQLRTSFEHLETNHQLLTPLYRTIRRMKVEITGAEVCQYLTAFFEKQFKKERIEFTYSESFSKYKFYTFESIIKPVFINIINNAIYWLTPSDIRKIRIEYIDSKILIINSGEPIHTLDLEEIFQLFVTKKPSGRGIGLYLAKSNLATIGYDIYATNDKTLNKLKGACFVIQKIGGEVNE